VLRTPSGRMEVLRQGRRDPLSQPHLGSVWIDEHRTTLPKNEWVAANERGLVGTDPSIDALMAKVRAKHLDLESVTIAFISDDSA
jgi:hypothetical protein